MGRTARERFTTPRCYSSGQVGGTTTRGLRTGLRARVGAAMGFGYIGYIWALFGCCTLTIVFGGSAALLYAYGRRQDRAQGAPSVSVDRVDDDAPKGGGGSAA